MRKISVLNFKGGVGKTSFVTNVGHKLALDGYNVLIVDCDLQANASTLLPEAKKPTLLDVIREVANATDAIQNARDRIRKILHLSPTFVRSSRTAAGSFSRRCSYHVSRSY